MSIYWPATTTRTEPCPRSCVHEDCANLRPKLTHEQVMEMIRAAERRQQVTRPASEIANEAKPMGVAEAEDQRTTHGRMASLLVAAAEQAAAGAPVYPRRGAV